jgi:enterochelin esterase family protein
MEYVKFSEILSQLESLCSEAQRKRFLDQLIARASTLGAPLFESDTRVVFLYRGEADSVGIVGDMTNWSEIQAFNRITATDVFYLQAEYPVDARLEYLLQVNGSEVLQTDPLNPFVSLNGLGTQSELAMPGYRHHPYFRDYRQGKKGEFLSIRTHQLPPGKLDYAHTFHVYLPPGFKEDEGDYPTIYFQDGEDYIEFAQVPWVLNKMINSGLIDPLIAVFVAPPNRHLPDSPNRMFEYGLNDDYVAFFADELVPFIESHYPVKKAADARLIIGDSFGGLISAYIPFVRPDVFGMAYSQSGYLSFRGDWLIRAFANSERKPVRLYVDTGHYERTVGTAFLPLEEADFLEANRRMQEVLKKKNYDFVYREYPEGHTWGNWRRHLIDALIHFFGKEQ